VKVLVVDDNALIRKMLRAVLEPEGVRCVEAVDVASAVASIKAETPDLCFLDLHLPDGDGLDVLRQIQAMAPHLPTPRVYLITGSDTEDVSGLALELGARGVLYKPFTPDQVLQKLRER
jgi:CheY-like chemotaxis protein